MINTEYRSGDNMSFMFKASILNRRELVIKQKLSGKFTFLASLVMFCSVALLCRTAVAAESASDIRDPMTYFFHQSFNNLEEELEIAVEENKSGVLIMFVEDDCPWCLKMKTTIMNRSAVQDVYREHFRLLTLDVNGDTLITDFEGKEMPEKDFASKHRVRATPVFIFFDTTGKKIMRFTGITRDVNEFIWLAEFVISGEYRNTNFTKYKQNRMKQEKVVSLNQSS